MTKLISYESVDGGVNNLQVARVMDGYSQIKVFTSKHHKAEQRADKFIKNNA